MYRYTTAQLAIITAIPTVTILLLWTVTIFHKNRNQWRPYDTCIVAILVQSVLRNLSTLAYTVLGVVSQATPLPDDYCTCAVWLFNSVHTFQASTLATLSVVGLLASRAFAKRKELERHLSTAHVVYHLFCLTALCACVGVAAILGRRHQASSANFEFPDRNGTGFNALEACQLMPYDLDPRYTAFVLVLHTLLALVSVGSFIGIIVSYYSAATFRLDYLKQSTSDLSLDCASNTEPSAPAKTFYDCNATKNERWTSDMSNISTSVSSTNSRRPCLLQQKKDENSAGLETIMPVLIVCYLFNHLPVVVICVFPWLPTPWTSGVGAVLFLGLIQDILLPTSLGLVDGRFNAWVSRAYRCGRSGRKTQQDKPPHGLDGKFRPFSSTPQNVQIASSHPVRSRPVIPPPIIQIISPDHKFPITNGSLYTSIDGRLPIIHNYRRHKGFRSPIHSINMGLHSTYIRHQESILNNQVELPPNDESFLSLPVDFNTAPKRTPSKTRIENVQSKSQNNLSDIQKDIENFQINPEAYRLRQQELQKDEMLSDVKQTNFQVNPETYRLRQMEVSHRLRQQAGKILENNYKIQNFQDAYRLRQSDMPYRLRQTGVPYQQDESLDAYHMRKDDESSDDEYCTNSFKNYDTISSQSCCSITTEANCDFEFYAQAMDGNGVPTGQPKPSLTTFKPNQTKSDENLINRSNSRSSLNGTYVIRSNSNRSYDVIRSQPDMLDMNVQSSKKGLQPKFLNASCVHLDRRTENEVPILFALNRRAFSYLDNGGICSHNYGGSVPDFKKVFVSEYI